MALVTFGPSSTKRRIQVRPGENSTLASRRRDSLSTPLDVKLKWLGQFKDDEKERRFKMTMQKHHHRKSAQSATRFLIFGSALYLIPILTSTNVSASRLVIGQKFYYFGIGGLVLTIVCFAILQTKVLRKGKHWLVVYLFVACFVLVPGMLPFFISIDRTHYFASVNNVRDNVLALQDMYELTHANTSLDLNFTQLVKSTIDSLASANVTVTRQLDGVRFTLAASSSSEILLVLSCGTALFFTHMSVERALTQHFIFFVVFHIVYFIVIAGSFLSLIRSTTSLAMGFVIVGMTVRQREATVRMIWYKHTSLREKAGRMKRIMTQLNINVLNDHSDKRDKNNNVKSSELEIITNHPGIQALLITVENLDIVEEIARGAMGDVYRASYFDTFVAVKRLPQHLMTKTNLFMFRDEILLLQSFRHPNVINLLGVACDSISFVAGIFELMPRGSLRSVLQDPQLTVTWEDPKVKFAVDIARGMSYLHERQVLHRDLKTDNVLVSSTFVCKVADFGTSKRMRDCTYTQIGTPFWRAPEMIRSEPYSFKADVYSFALILLELQTHENPFESLTKEQAMDFPHKVSQEEWRFSIPPQTPPEIKSLIQDCWTEDPDKRPTFLLILRRLSQLQKSFSRDDAQARDSNLERLMLDEMIMSGRYTRISYADGEPIIRAGDLGEDCYIVLKGEVEIMRPHQDMKLEMPVHTSRENMQLIQTIQTGAYFGEMGLLAHTRRMASCLAKGAVTCIKFDRTAFLEVFDEEVHGLVASRIVRVLQGSDKNKNDEHMDTDSQTILRKMGSLKNPHLLLSPTNNANAKADAIKRRSTMESMPEHRTTNVSNGSTVEEVQRKISNRFTFDPNAIERQGK